MSSTPHPEHSIHDLLSKRRSPYALSGRQITDRVLRSIFEAARWSPSSFNEQPWRYIVARRSDRDRFQSILGCLVEGNQAWARRAAVLALGCVSTTFRRNGAPNRVALHDLGLASMSLTVEAMRHRVFVHQMAGILPEVARSRFRIPRGCEVVTGLALGYLATPGSAPPELQAKDELPNERRPLAEFVFGGVWGEPEFR